MLEVLGSNTHLAVSLILEDWIPRAQHRQCSGRAIIMRVDMNGSHDSKADDLSHHGLELLGAGNPVEAAREFRAAIVADENHVEAHHGLVRALRDSGRLEEAIGAALRLIVLTPQDPLAHTALSISLQTAGHVPEAEAAAARARVLEWKIALQSPPGVKQEL